MNIYDLRRAYHKQIYEEIINVKHNREGLPYPNFADGSSRSSREISMGILRRMEATISYGSLAGQTAGNRFETVTKDFVEKAFVQLQHLRPGRWIYSVSTAISAFEQYEHLHHLSRLRETTDDPQLANALAEDYIVTPDIVIARLPVSDEEINKGNLLLNDETPVARYSPLRESNHTGNVHPLLHASISCKWTLRSDRAQNARTEALNLVRNRKGHLPHVVVITAEPLPTRIAALALGTGDLDCVYHFALTELSDAIQELRNEDQMDMLETLISGKRLRDISDLPFDIAI